MDETKREKQKGKERRRAERGARRSLFRLYCVCVCVWLLARGMGDVVVKCSRTYESGKSKSDKGDCTQIYKKKREKKKYEDNQRSGGE